MNTILLSEKHYIISTSDTVYPIKKPTIEMNVTTDRYTTPKGVTENIAAMCYNNIIPSGFDPTLNGNSF